MGGTGAVIIRKECRTVGIIHDKKRLLPRQQPLFHCGTKLGQSDKGMASTLSSQLKYLEKEGLVSRTAYAEVPPRVEYSLTLMGKRFVPVLGSIQVWEEEYIEFLKANRSIKDKIQSNEIL